MDRWLSYSVRLGCGRTQLGCLLFAALLLSGCATGLARPARGAPVTDTDVTVVVFNDGFHSGLLVPRSPELADLDPQAEGPAVALPWLELGFGADAWVAAHDPGCCTATWLIFSRSPGVLMCEHLANPTRKPRDPNTTLHLWPLRFTAAAWQRLSTEIRTWVDTGLVQPRQPTQASFMRFSTKRWTSFRNCNDFVIETLAPAGLEMVWRPAYTVSGFAAVMEGVVTELERDGIKVIDVGLAPTSLMKASLKR